MLYQSQQNSALELQDVAKLPSKLWNNVSRPGRPLGGMGGVAAGWPLAALGGA